MDLINLADISGERIVVIDTETGTVLDPKGLRLTYVPSTMMEDVLSSDSTAIDLARRTGENIYADADEW